MISVSLPPSGVRYHFQVGANGSGSPSGSAASAADAVNSSPTVGAVSSIVTVPDWPSSALVTVTAIVWSAVIARVPAPLVARTVTSWMLSVPESCGSSKSGADLNVSSPVVAPISNRAMSAPPAIA